jgi:hypothetical protein
MRTTKPAPAITIEEATRLYEQVDTTDIDRAVKLYEHFFNEEKNQYGSNWALTSAIACVYAIGRVQGIRDERNRRKQRSLTLEEQ